VPSVFWYSVVPRTGQARTAKAAMRAAMAAPPAQAAGRQRRPGNRPLGNSSSRYGPRAKSGIHAKENIQVASAVPGRPPPWRLTDSQA
jgi:hypothetical protein